MAITIDGVPGLNQNQETVLLEAAKAAGITLVFALGAGLLGYAIGARTAAVLYTFGAFGYGLLVSEGQPLVAAGLMASSLVSVTTLMFGAAAAQFQSVTRAAGALPAAVKTFAPLPYQVVQAWR